MKGFQVVYIGKASDTFSQHSRVGVSKDAIAKQGRPRMRDKLKLSEEKDRLTSPPSSGKKEHSQAKDEEFSQMSTAIIHDVSRSPAGALSARIGGSFIGGAFLGAALAGFPGALIGGLGSLGVSIFLARAESDKKEQNQEQGEEVLEAK
jgi:hypothetical protein